MDPFLEDPRLWPEFQHLLITCLYQALLPGLVDRYRARVGQRNYFIEQALFTSVIREEHAEEFIEIRQRGHERLVTVIEILAPANKATSVGRQHYLGHWQACKIGGANIVEIDLVLQGQPPRGLTPNTQAEGEFAITVSRANRQETVEAFNLQRALPRFRLPLAGDDRDMVVELHVVFNRAYDLAAFAGKIDYKLPPAAALLDTDRQWLNALLKKQKLR
jgi:uncharacterized protein DUF4058